MKKYLLFCSLIITLTIQIFAQSRARIINEDIEPLIQKNIVNGSYGLFHFVNSTKELPIVNLMKESNYCEIVKGYIRVKNCATEPFDDGIAPVYEISIERISSLMRLELLEYYSALREEYNTPLKLKRFKESGDYAHHIEYLKIDKEHFLDNTYYAIREITGNKEKTFDLDNSCFSLKLPWSLNSNECRDIILETSDTHFRGNRFVTPKIDEETAYEIESNPCGLFVWVKFNGETRTVGAWVPAICEPKKVCIVNMNTGEIYLEYTPQNNQIIPSQDYDIRDVKDHSNNKDIEEFIYKDITQIDKLPEFPGGEGAFIKFINENLVYPEEAIKNNKQGRAIVKFTVTKDGSLKNIKIVKSTNSFELDREAARVFSLPTMPKWKPGTHNGEAVNVNYSFPIRFVK